MTAAADMPEWVREGLSETEERCLRCDSPSAAPGRVHIRTADGSFDCHADPAATLADMLDAFRGYPRKEVAGPGFDIHDLVVAERLANAEQVLDVELVFDAELDDPQDEQSTLTLDVLDAELLEVADD